MSSSFIVTTFELLLWTVGDLCPLDADDTDINDRSLRVSVSMEYDLRGKANVETDKLSFDMVELMCLMCFIDISGTDRLHSVSSNRWHSKHTSGCVSCTFNVRLLRSERCNGGERLPVRSNRRYSLCQRRRRSCWRIEPVVVDWNIRLKFGSEPVDAELTNPFGTMVDAEDVSVEYGDELRLRSRDSNEWGIRSLAGGDGAVEAFISENTFRCVANWCLQKENKQLLIVT